MGKIPKDIFKEQDILVIDDDPSSLHVVTLILEFYNAHVHTAMNGQEGLQLAKTLHPMFIITDISMPIMNGWELIETLRKDIQTANIPIIVLTAHAMNDTRKQAMAAGCHNFLTKPLDPKTFVHDLLRILEDIPELATSLNNI